MKDRYWNTMTERKYDLLYLSICFQESIVIDRAIRIICAIASCSSIAAWTIWNKYAFVWGFIIAVSQVITAIYEMLPYQKRIADIAVFKSELEKIYLKMEKQWYLVFEDKISDDKINEILSSFDEEWDDISNKFFSDDALPQSKRYKKFAMSESKRYFYNKFGVDYNE